MLKNRATVVTRSSLIVPCKVLSSRSFACLIKSFRLLRSFSTATERSDFQNANGYHVDNSPEYCQNNDGYYRGNENPAFAQQNHHAVQKSYRPSGAVSDGHSRGSSLEVRQSTNATWAYGENPRHDFVTKPPRQSETTNGFYGERYGGPNPNNFGVNQNYNGAYRQNSFRNNQDYQNVNTSGYGGQNNGAYGESRTQFQRYPAQSSLSANLEHTNVELQQKERVVDGSQHCQDGLYSGNGHVENPYGSYSEAPTGIPYNPEGFSGGNGRVAMSNTGQFKERLDGHWTLNDGINQHTVGAYQQNPTSGQNQQNSYSVELSQQNPAQDQQNLNSGIFQQNYYSAQYQQTGHGEHYRSNLNTVQSNVSNSESSNSLQAEGPSTEVSEDSQYSGTLEELDALCKEGKVKEALEVLKLLEKQYVPVDLARYLELMQACGDAKSLQEAKVVHDHIVRTQSPIKVSTYNRILEIYSKCGSMDDAFLVFNNMPKRNMTSWDTMISWLAKNSLGEDAIDLFSQFKKAGLKPDGKLFIGVFSACSVVGDVDEGMLHFESMKNDYGIVPSVDHYLSIVDMLGSVGHLDEALEFIERMPLEPSVAIWETMMNLCRVHGHMELGDRCAELVEQLDSTHLDEKSKAGLVPIKTSELAKEKEKKNLASQNLLEVRSRVHEYRAGDTSHPENDRIYALLRGMREQMKESGYIPETRFVLHDIDQEGKEDALLAHSERLAVAYGLLSSSARSPIRVIKNLRVCGDCHSALKIISKVVGRELIIRDAKRFHHFKDGLCSCRDYW